MVGTGLWLVDLVFLGWTLAIECCYSCWSQSWLCLLLCFLATWKHCILEKKLLNYSPSNTQKYRLTTGFKNLDLMLITGAF